MQEDNQEAYDTWSQQDIVGTRELTSRRCLEMDWSNKKEITAWEMAYCIYTYKLDLNKVPETILRTVNEELTKLQNIDKKEKERKLIESELKMYEYPSNGKGKFFQRIELEDSYMESDLFNTLEEAELAMEELSSCYSHESTKISEYEHEYKDDNYCTKVKALKKAAAKLAQQYTDLGGSETEFWEGMSQITLPDRGTLKQDINQHREAITKRLIDIDVSSTKADKIAKAITIKVYDLLKKSF